MDLIGNCKVCIEKEFNVIEPGYSPFLLWRLNHLAILAVFNSNKRQGSTLSYGVKRKNLLSPKPFVSTSRLAQSLCTWWSSLRMARTLMLYFVLGSKVICALSSDWRGSIWLNPLATDLTIYKRFVVIGIPVGLFHVSVIVKSWTLVMRRFVGFSKAKRRTE